MAARSGGASGDGDEEEDDGGANAALRKTLKVMSDREEWRVGTDNAVVGEVLTLMKEQWKEIHQAFMGVTKDYVALLHRTRELDILDKDHEPTRVAEMAKAKLLDAGVGALTEGAKAIKYLVMDAGGGNGNGERSLPAKRMTKLQAVIAEFIRDCEAAKVDDHPLDELLFGKVESGKMVKDGIFTSDQGRILVLVRDGELPEIEVERLLPMSGDPLQITGEQYQKAEPLLKKAGLEDAIKIVFGFCMKARAARTEQSKPQETATP
jgi:hypothetical protein